MAVSLCLLWSSIPSSLAQEDVLLVPVLPTVEELPVEQQPLIPPPSLKPWYTDPNLPAIPTIPGMVILPSDQPEDETLALPEWTDEELAPIDEENSYELTVSAAQSARSVYATEETVSYYIEVTGGQAPYFVKVEVQDAAGQTAYERRVKLAEDGGAAFRYIPQTGGMHKMTATVQDSAAGRGRASLKLPVAVHDPERASEWEKSVSSVTLTGDWRIDLPQIARTQVGYTESNKDFIVDDEGLRNGYTRYGAWYGSAYAEWCGMFISFCLSYAGIAPDQFPRNANVDNYKADLRSYGAYEDDEDAYWPEPGDLVFFNWEGRNTPEHMGIVEDVNGDTIYTIEGNSANQVRRNAYSVDDYTIVGYASITRMMKVAGINVDETADGADAESADLYDVSRPATTTKGAVNMRGAADASSRRVKKIEKSGTEVMVMGEKTVDGQLWYFVSYEDAIGYVRGDLIAVAPIEEDVDGLTVEDEPECTCLTQTGVHAQTCPLYVNIPCAECYTMDGTMVCDDGCECACHQVQATDASATVLFAYDQRDMAGVPAFAVTEHTADPAAIKAVLANQSLTVDDMRAWDLTVLGAEVNGDVTVSLPVPAEWTGDVAAWYLPADDQPVRLDSTVRDGLCTFTTDHFSVYAITSLRDILPEEIEYTVSVSIAPAAAQIGDTLVFTANVEGVDPARLTYQWQYSADGVNWIDIPGETEQVYSVEATMHQFLHYHRVETQLKQSSGSSALGVLERLLFATAVAEGSTVASGAVMPMMLRNTSVVYWNPDPEPTYSEDGRIIVPGGDDTHAEKGAENHPFLTLAAATAWAQDNGASTIICMNLYEVDETESFAPDSTMTITRYQGSDEPGTAHSGMFFSVSEGTLTLKNLNADADDTVVLADGGNVTLTTGVTLKGPIDLNQPSVSAFPLTVSANNNANGGKYTVTFNPEYAGRVGLVSAASDADAETQMGRLALHDSLTAVGWQLLRSGSKVYAWIPPTYEAVYVNGVMGSDDNTGHEPSAPVKTLEQAIYLLNNNDVDIIYVINTVAISGNDEFKLPAGKKVQRYSSCVNPLIEVTGGSPTLNMTIDGAFGSTNGATSLVRVSGGSVTLGAQSVLSGTNGYAVQVTGSSSATILSGAQITGGGAVWSSSGSTVTITSASLKGTGSAAVDLNGKATLNAVTIVGPTGGTASFGGQATVSDSTINAGSASTINGSGGTLTLNKVNEGSAIDTISTVGGLNLINTDAGSVSTGNTTTLDGSTVSASFANTRGGVTVKKDSVINCDATAGGSLTVTDTSRINGAATVSGSVSLSDTAYIEGDVTTTASGNVSMTGTNHIGGNVDAAGSVAVGGSASYITGSAKAGSYVTVNPGSRIEGAVTAGTSATITDPAKLPPSVDAGTYITISMTAKPDNAALTHAIGGGNVTLTNVDAATIKAGGSVNATNTVANTITASTGVTANTVTADTITSGGSVTLNAATISGNVTKTGTSGSVTLNAAVITGNVSSAATSTSAAVSMTASTIGGTLTSAGTVELVSGQNDIGSAILTGGDLVATASGLSGRIGTVQLDGASSKLQTNGLVTTPSVVLGGSSALVALTQAISQNIVLTINNEVDGRVVVTTPSTDAVNSSLSHFSRSANSMFKLMVSGNNIILDAPAGLYVDTVKGSQWAVDSSDTEFKLGTTPENALLSFEDIPLAIDHYRSIDEDFPGVVYVVDGSNVKNGDSLDANAIMGDAKAINLYAYEQNTQDTLITIDSDITFTVNGSVNIDAGGKAKMFDVAGTLNVNSGKLSNAQTIISQTAGTVTVGADAHIVMTASNTGVYTTGGKLTMGGLMTVSSGYGYTSYSYDCIHSVDGDVTLSSTARVYGRLFQESGEVRTEAGSHLNILRVYSGSAVVHGAIVTIDAYDGDPAAHSASWMDLFVARAMAEAVTNIVIDASADVGTLNINNNSGVSDQIVVDLNGGDVDNLNQHGGTVNANNNSSVSIDLIVDRDDGIVNVKGGVVNSITQSTGVVTVTGGTLKRLTTSGGEVDISGGMVNRATVTGGTVAVSGGTIEYSSFTSTAAALDLDVTGGTFEQACSIGSGTYGSDVDITNGTFDASLSITGAVDKTIVDISDGKFNNVTQGSASASSKGGTVTMTGGTVNGTYSLYAPDADGKLYLNGTESARPSLLYDVYLYGKGSILHTNGYANLGKVFLGKNQNTSAYMTGTNAHIALSGIMQDTVSIVVGDSNYYEGYPCVRPEAPVTDVTDQLNKFNLNTMKRRFNLAKGTDVPGSSYPTSLVLAFEGVFIDTVNGSDANNGLTASSAVKTFTRVAEVMTDQATDADFIRVIYVVGGQATTDANPDNNELDFSNLGGSRPYVMAYTPTTPVLVTIPAGHSMIAKNVDLDGLGNNAGLQTQKVVDVQGTLNAENASIKNGRGTVMSIGANGSATLTNVTVETHADYRASAIGVDITGGKLTMNSGTAVNYGNPGIRMNGGELYMNDRSTLYYSYGLSMTNDAVAYVDGRITSSRGNAIDATNSTVYLHKKDTPDSCGEVSYTYSGYGAKLTNSKLYMGNSGSISGTASAGVYMSDADCLVDMNAGGSIHGGRSHGVHMVSGQLKMGPNASIYSNSGIGVTVTGGTASTSVITMDGSQIYANSLGGVSLASGTFNMTSGTISDNGTSSPTVGGVKVSSGAAFHMTTGTISGNGSINSSSMNGGGVWVTSGGTFTMANGTIRNNKAANGGGIYAASGANMTITQATITGNASRYDGGGVYWACVNGNLAASMTITNNTAGTTTTSGAVNTTGNGGGLYIEGNDPTHTHTFGSTYTITGNKATNGSAVYSACGGTVNFEGSLTDNGPAVQNGGVLYVKKGTVNVTGSATFSPTATATHGSGGLVYVEGGKVSLDLTGETIKGSAGANGGAVYVKGGTVDITGGNFAGSHAGSNGGAVAVENATVTMTDTTMTGSTAGVNGGALSVAGGKVTVTNVNMSGSTATSGNGGALSVSGGKVTVTNVNMSGSTATSGNGGAVCITGGSLTGTGCNLSDSKAVNGNGGALYASGVTVSLTGTGTDLGGSKAKNGGAVYAENSTTTITDADLTNSTATVNGGAAFITGGKATITDATISGSSATGEGDALYADASAAVDFGFSGSFGTSGQNAIYMDNGANVNHLSGTVTSNVRAGGNYTIKLPDATVTGTVDITTGYPLVIHEDSTALPTSSITVKANEYFDGAVIVSGTTNVFAMLSSEQAGGFIVTGYDSYTRIGKDIMGGQAVDVFWDPSAIHSYTADTNPGTSHVRAVKSFDRAKQLAGQMGPNARIVMCSAFDTTKVTNVTSLDGTISGTGTYAGKTWIAKLVRGNGYTNPNTVAEGPLGAMFSFGVANKAYTFTNLDISGEHYNGKAQTVYEPIMWVKSIDGVVLNLNNVAMHDNTIVGVGIEYAAGIHHKASDGEGTINIANCHFYNLHGEEGGAIKYPRSGDDNLKATITGSTFENNSQTSVMSGEGGAAIFLRGCEMLVLENNVFRNNSAKLHGGAVSISVHPLSNFTLNIKDNKFYNNDSDGNGGAMCLNIDNFGGDYYKVDTVFENNIFEDNSATVEGGALYFSYSHPTATTTFSNNTFKNNSANQKGGAVCLPNSDNTGRETGVYQIKECIFTGNTGTDGGAVYAEWKKQVTVENCEFTNNTSNGTNTAHGGGAMYVGYCPSVKIKDSTFTGNTASKNGGALHVSNSGGETLSVHYNTFENNTSGGNGGAVHAIVPNAQGSLEGNTFTGNKADMEGKSKGGALYYYDGGTKGALDILNDRYEGNSAYEGGAVYCTDSSEIYVENTAFTANTANGNGGALAAYSAGAVTIIVSEFNNNTAVSMGGAVYTSAGDGSDNIEIRDSIFNGNAAYFGAVLYAGLGSNSWMDSSRYFELDGCTMTGNKAHTGIIYSFGAKCKGIDNCVIGNEAATAYPTSSEAALQSGGNSVENEIIWWVLQYGSGGSGASVSIAEDTDLSDGVTMNNTKVVGNYAPEGMLQVSVYSGLGLVAVDCAIDYNSHDGISININPNSPNSMAPCFIGAKLYGTSVSYNGGHGVYKDSYYSLETYASTAGNHCKFNGNGKDGLYIANSDNFLHDFEAVGNGEHGVHGVHGTSKTNMALNGTIAINNNAQHGLYAETGEVSFGSAIKACNITVNGNGSTDVEKGGGLYLPSGVKAKFSVESMTVSGNTAQEGAGMYIAHTGTNAFELQNMTFSGNTATTGNGGGLLAEGDYLLSNVAFSGNKAGANGGGAYISGKATSTAVYNYIDTQGNNIPKVNSVPFTGNTAGANGGGLYTTGDSNLMALRLDGNTAGQYGGGYYPAAKAIVNAYSITGNTALLGGGLYAPGDDNELDVQDADVFKGNQSTGDGNLSGGIYNLGRTLKMSGSAVAIEDNIYLYDVNHPIDLTGHMSKKSNYRISVRMAERNNPADTTYYYGDTVVRPSGTRLTDAAQYLNRTTSVLEGQVFAKGGTSATSKNIVLKHCLFVDGVNGSDSNTGELPKIAMRSMPTALRKAASIEGGAVIFVVNTVTVSSNETWEADDSSHSEIRRYTGFRVGGSTDSAASAPAFTGDMVCITDGATLTIDGDTLYRVSGRHTASDTIRPEGSIFHVESGTLELTDTLTLDGNFSNADGGVINLDGGTVNVRGEVTISDAQGGNGGAINVGAGTSLNIPGTLNIQYVTAANGAGIYNAGDVNITGTLNVNDATATRSGGAIYNDQNVTLSGTLTTTGASATRSGGALYHGSSNGEKNTFSIASNANITSADSFFVTDGQVIDMKALDGYTFGDGSINVDIGDAYDGRVYVQYPADADDTQLNQFKLPSAINSAYINEVSLDNRTQLRLRLGNIVYVDPESGSDSNNGLSADTAFATMRKAYEYLASRDQKNGLIYIVEPITVSGNTTVGAKYYTDSEGTVPITTGDGGVSIRRYSQPLENYRDAGQNTGTFFKKGANTKTMFNLTDGTLIFDGIMVDGHSSAVTTATTNYTIAPAVATAQPIVNITGSGKLELTGGAMLTNNGNAATGEYYAVYNGSKTHVAGETTITGVVKLGADKYIDVTAIEQVITDSDVDADGNPITSTETRIVSPATGPIEVVVDDKYDYRIIADYDKTPHPDQVNMYQIDDLDGYRIMIAGNRVVLRKMGAVYVNGVSGSDDNDGYTADTAVATMRRAYELMAQENTANGVIYVVDTVAINGNVTMTSTSYDDGTLLELPAGQTVKIMRYSQPSAMRDSSTANDLPGFTAESCLTQLLNVTVDAQLTLENITLDGHRNAVNESGCVSRTAPGVEAKFSLIYADGDVVLNDGAVLQNNYNTYSGGGALNVLPTGSATLYGATISGNAVASGLRGNGVFLSGSMTLAETPAIDADQWIYRFTKSNSTPVIQVLQPLASGALIPVDMDDSVYEDYHNIASYPAGVDPQAECFVLGQPDVMTQKVLSKIGEETYVRLRKGYSVTYVLTPDKVGKTADSMELTLLDQEVTAKLIPLGKAKLPKTITVRVMPAGKTEWNEPLTMYDPNTGKGDYEWDPVSGNIRVYASAVTGAVEITAQVADKFDAYYAVTLTATDGAPDSVTIDLTKDGQKHPTTGEVADVEADLMTEKTYRLLSYGFADDGAYCAVMRKPADIAAIKTTAGYDTANTNFAITASFNGGEAISLDELDSLSGSTNFTTAATLSKAELQLDLSNCNAITLDGTAAVMRFVLCSDTDTEVGDTITIDVTIDREPSQLSVTVPLVVVMRTNIDGGSGDLSQTSYAIDNDSSMRIQLTNVEVQSASSTLTYADTFTGVDQYNLGMADELTRSAAATAGSVATYTAQKDLMANGETGETYNPIDTVNVSPLSFVTVDDASKGVHMTTINYTVAIPQKDLATTKGGD